MAMYTPIRHGEDRDVRRIQGDIQRHRASSALRRLVFAAAACDGAAGAAAFAADEIAQLRQDVLRSQAREDQRSRLSAFSQSWPALPTTAERERASENATQQRLVAEQTSTDVLQRQKNYKASRAQERVAEVANKSAERREADEAKELLAALQEARSELASARREEQEAAEVGNSAKSEADSLLKRLKRSEAAANDEAAVLKTSEAAVVERLRQELSTSRSRVSSEVQEATEAKKVARTAVAARDALEAEVADMEQLRRDLKVALKQVTEAEREIASEASRSDQLQHDLEAARIKLRNAEKKALHEETVAVEASVAQKEHNQKEVTLARQKADAIEERYNTEEAIARRLRSEIVLTQSRQVLLMRREEACRNALTGALARRWEEWTYDLVRSAFQAWRYAEAATREAETSEKQCAAITERQSAEFEKRLSAVTAEASEANRRVLALQADEQAAASSRRLAEEALNSEAATVKRLQESVDSLRLAKESMSSELLNAEAKIKENLGARHAAIELLLMRQVEASRHVISNLLATQLETIARSAFCAWRDCQLEAAAAISAVSSTTLPTSPNSLAGSEVERLRSALAESKATVTRTESMVAEASQALESSLESRNSLVMELRERSDSCKEAEAALQEELRTQASRLANEGAASEQALSSEASQVKLLGERINALENTEAAFAQEVLKEVRSAKQSENTCMAEASESVANMRVVLAKGEEMAQQAADVEARKKIADVRHKADEALRERMAELQASRTEAAAATQSAQLATAEAEAAQEALLAFKEEAAVSGSGSIRDNAMLLMASRGEAAARTVLATLLAKDLERCVRGTFYVWCDFVDLTHREAEQAEQAASMYLPRVLSGKQVLELVDEDTWRSSNALKSATAGLVYRTSKSLGARMANAAYLPWGETIQGFDEGDGWVRVQLQQAHSLETPPGSPSKARMVLADAPEKVADLQEVARLREALDSSAVMCSILSRREEAARCVLTNLLAAQLELIVAGAFDAWRNVCNSSGTCDELHQEEKLAEYDRDGLLHQAKEAFLLHRESTARRVLSTLLAERIELEVRVVFCAWCDAIAQPSLAAPMVPDVQRSIASLSESLGDIMHARQQDAATRVLSTVLAREVEALMQRTLIGWTSVILSDMLAERKELLQRSLTGWHSLVSRGPASSQAELARREAFITRQGSTMMLLARQVEASRSVLANVLASKLELIICGAFLAWRSACDEVDTTNVADTPGLPPSTTSLPVELPRSASPAPALSRSPSSDGFQEGDWYAQYHGDADPEL